MEKKFRELWKMNPWIVDLCHNLYCLYEGIALVAKIQNIFEF